MYSAAGQVQQPSQQIISPPPSGTLSASPSSSPPAMPTAATTLTTFLSSAYNVSVGQKTFTLGLGAGILGGLLVGYIVFKR